MHIRSALIFRELGEMENAASNFEKAKHWDDARICRERIMGHRGARLYSEPYEREHKGPIKSRQALWICIVFSILTSLLVLSMFVPAWYTVDLERPYPSDNPDVSRVEVSYKEGWAPNSYREELEVHSYGPDGEEVYAEDGDVPLFEGHELEDNYHSCKDHEGFNMLFASDYLFFL